MYLCRLYCIYCCLFLKHDKMKVALLQYPIVWADVEANLHLFGQRLAAVAGQAAVALLPEMFTTGFCTKQPDLADSIDGKSVATLRKWAADYSLAIAGSFMCREGDKLYNRGFFIRPDGSSDFIDKRHLYASGGESEFFSPGKERVISEYMGVRFCLQVCYDLRFPVWMRNRTGHDYDILLISANWPDVRIQAWDVLLKARALENQCYIAGVNLVGTDGMGLHYPGHSVAYNTRLQPIAWLPEDQEGTVIADFDVAKLAYFREVLPLWKDADAFTLLD